MEAAFQGRFRWTKQARDLHGDHFPRRSRIFQMWDSGNREDRFFENPTSLI
tara:strand:- start:1055 stop:1207 length:153 start_codon:yes stop_codon:yes gene_type:complete